VNHWVNTTTEQVQRGIEQGDRLLMVRYEDLVLQPEKTLREVFDWLDEPWSDRLLEHDKVHAERGTARRVEGATRSDKPIGTDRLAAWTDGRTPQQMQVLVDKAGDLAGFYGYDLTDPERLSPFHVPSAPGRVTLTGTMLAERKAMFPALSAELDREITPWAGNRMLTPEAFGVLQGPGRKPGVAPAQGTAARRGPLRRALSRLRSARGSARG
jgi:hypothetical protein